MWKWLKKRRLNSAYTNGYEYAKSVILNGDDKSLSRLYNEIDISHTFHDFGEFELGMRHAITEFKTKQGIS